MSKGDLAPNTHSTQIEMACNEIASQQWREILSTVLCRDQQIAYHSCSACQAFFLRTELVALDRWCWGPPWRSMAELGVSLFPVTAEVSEHWSHTSCGPLPVPTSTRTLITYESVRALKRVCFFIFLIEEVRCVASSEWHGMISGKMFVGSTLQAFGGKGLRGSFDKG